MLSTDPPARKFNCLRGVTHQSGTSDNSITWRCLKNNLNLIMIITTNRQSRGMHN